MRDCNAVGKATLPFLPEQPDMPSENPVFSDGLFPINPV
ncbi:hypothetical protein J2T37_001626 [Neisseria perflava]|nr:hypothetical protein [Neisseria perflava]MCP1771882.1 hypothetical protein [Neisseria perflava]